MAQARERGGSGLTPLELEIMQALWAEGAGTVAQVQARLGSGLAYTTVQTMLNVLLRKKKVSRETAGKAYVYRPAVTRQGATASALSDLVGRMFGGSGEALLMSLIDARQITAEEIARAARVLEAAEAQRKAEAEGNREGGE
jgi:predicted transcriptional regulator